MQVNFVKNGVTRSVKKGFSWTTLFFGGFNLLFFRKEYMNGIILLIVAGFTGWVAPLVYAFFANRSTARNLMENGWVPVGGESPQVKSAILSWQT